MATSLRLSFGFRDARAIVANLYAADKRAQKEIRRAVKDVGEFGRSLAYFLAPVDTSFMRDHLKESYSDDGLTVELGFDAEDFQRLRPTAPPYPARGHPLYAKYVEEGTTRQKAQPFLAPTFEEMQEMLSGDISVALRRSLTRR